MPTSKNASTAKIIYFDNAATSYPKPKEVLAAQAAFARNCANPNRGAHKLAMASAAVVFQARCLLAQFLGIKAPERLIFTPGCTYSINMALKGLSWQKGDVVLVSALEHNAVMRTLKQLEDSVGIKVHVLPYAKEGIVNLHDLVEALLATAPKLCVIAEASNVTGEVVDLSPVVTICRAHRVPVMVDAAQAAGKSKSNIEELGISLWCASGHKGLMGPTGVGVLYVAQDIKLSSLITGGTGSRSEELAMPEQYPDHLEAGTMPGPAIAGLKAGVEWLVATGVEKIVNQEKLLLEQFLSWAQTKDFMQVFGSLQSSKRTATVSFNIAGISSDLVAQKLDSEFDIAVRAGLHCASAAHAALGTLQTGLVRASFSVFNTSKEIEYFTECLTEIAQHTNN